MKISPLAPEQFPEMPPIAGVHLGTAAAGIKYLNRDDLMLATFSPDCTVAGVLTRSETASAPVHWCRNGLKSGTGRALFVNAGNANAFTGKAGFEDVKVTCQWVAQQVGCDQDDVFIASTGVIGETLPMDRITSRLDSLYSTMSGNGWRQASEAILTTDTFAKGASRKVRIGDTRVTINGFCKGSGMIEPDMATMLAFVFTDARIPGKLLQTLLVEANRNSFNAITVDSDTSTSDTCLLFATGEASHASPESAAEPLLDDFRNGLNDLMKDLAVQVVCDGEGASKLIEVVVSGAENDDAARMVAKSIANSPLVKTAIAGEDANWGRVVMAVGKSGQRCAEERMKIGFGGMLVAENGQRSTDYDESLVTQHLKGQHVEITVELGAGQGHFRVWTCDLTHGCISINADYRS